MQYKVPQNVDMEDKVIGPLTVRQFIILLITAGFLMFANFIFIGPLRFLFFLSVIIVVGGGLMIAFFKYGDQNAEVFLLSAYKTFINPKSRVWKKEEIKPEPAKTMEPKLQEGAPVEKRLNVVDARSGLEKLAEIVDTGGYATLKKPPEEASDLLAKVEKKDENFEKILDSASKTAPKRDQLVSEMASLPPLPVKETPRVILRNRE
jgi:hypothetical protein